MSDKCLTIEKEKSFERIFLFKYKSILKKKIDRFCRNIMAYT